MSLLYLSSSRVKSGTTDGASVIGSPPDSPDDVRKSLLHCWPSDAHHTLYADPDKPYRMSLGVDPTVLDRPLWQWVAVDFDDHSQDWVSETQIEDWMRSILRFDPLPTAIFGTRAGARALWGLTKPVDALTWQAIAKGVHNRIEKRLGGGESATVAGLEMCGSALRPLQLMRFPRTVREGYGERLWSRPVLWLGNYYTPSKMPASKRLLNVSGARAAKRAKLVDLVSLGFSKGGPQAIRAEPTAEERLNASADVDDFGEVLEGAGYTSAGTHGGEPAWIRPGGSGQSLRLFRATASSGTDEPVLFFQCFSSEDTVLGGKSGPLSRLVRLLMGEAMLDRLIVGVS